MKLTEEITITSLNENALLVSFGNVIDLELNEKVIALVNVLSQNPFAGFIEAVPAYSSLAIFYDIAKVRSENKDHRSAFEFVSSFINDLLSLKEYQNKTSNHRLVEVPVLYDGEDLDYISTHHRQTKEKTIQLHTSSVYRVFMIGFLPGFAYMGTLDRRLATPRKAVARTQVPAGSVGIAGFQTGIYPQNSPGGWQLIGRTPVRIFDKEKASPCLLNPGDNVKFVAIDKKEFDQLHEY